MKENEGDVIYYREKVNLIVKKGTREADHAHEMPEIFYLTKGKTELTVGDQTKIVEASMRIRIGSNVYHKYLAQMIEDKNKGMENTCIKE
ncbi:MAG: cupin domain-containing protein [archaeon]|nr:cupin domain-containing protein [archaeon]